MQKRVSIIISLYNMEQFIGRCLQSVINQDYDNLQIIVADNESTDKSIQIVKEYQQKDSRIELYQYKHSDVPQTVAALKEANGQYLGFVCSDDWIEKDFVSSLVKVLEESGADICTCSHFYTVLDSEEVDYITGCDSGEVRTYGREEGLQQLLTDDEIRSFLWDKLYKKEVWKDIQIDSTNKYDDMGVMYKIFLKADKIVYLDKPLYYYYQRTRSILHQGGNKLWWDLFRTYCEQLDYIPNEFEDCRDIVIKHIVEYGISRYKGWLISDEVFDEKNQQMQAIRNRINEVKGRYFTKRLGNIKQNISLLLFTSRYHDNLYMKLKRGKLD